MYGSPNLQPCDLWEKATIERAVRQNCSFTRERDGGPVRGRWFLLPIFVSSSGYCYVRFKSPEPDETGTISPESNILDFLCVYRFEIGFRFAIEFCLQSHHPLIVIQVCPLLFCVLCSRVSYFCTLAHKCNSR